MPWRARPADYGCRGPSGGTAGVRADALDHERRSVEREEDWAVKRATTRAARSSAGSRRPSIAVRRRCSRTRRGAGSRSRGSAASRAPVACHRRWSGSGPRRRCCPVPVAAVLEEPVTADVVRELFGRGLVCAQVGGVVRGLFRLEVAALPVDLHDLGPRGVALARASAG